MANLRSPRIFEAELLYIRLILGLNHSPNTFRVTKFFLKYLKKYHIHVQYFLANPKTRIPQK